MVKRLDHLSPTSKSEPEVSRSRISPVPPAGTVSRYHSAAFVPVSSGFTVAAPWRTWSPIPSFGYGVEPFTPHRRGPLFSFSHTSPPRRPSPATGLGEELW